MTKGDITFWMIVAFALWWIIKNYAPQNRRNREAERFLESLGQDELAALL